jgi:hypothetical protein
MRADEIEAAFFASGPLRRIRIGTFAASVYIPFMRGRFTYRLTWPELVRLYGLTLDAPSRNTQSRYSICPTALGQAMMMRR